MRKTIQVLTEVQQCAEGWDKSACLVGNVRAGDIATACRNAVRRLKALSATNTAQHRKAGICPECFGLGNVMSGHGPCTHKCTACGGSGKRSAIA